MTGKYYKDLSCWGCRMTVDSMEQIRQEHIQEASSEMSQPVRRRCGQEVSTERQKALGDNDWKWWGRCGWEKWSPERTSSQPLWEGSGQRALQWLLVGSPSCWHHPDSQTHTETTHTYPSQRLELERQSWVKVFAAKLDYLSLIFGTHMAEGENQLLQVVLCILYVGMWVLTNVINEMVKHKKSWRN